MYDNKIMRAMTFLADLVFANILYLVCCLGVVTIGAAQSGLFTAIRAMLDKEDGTPVSRAFFRGLRTGIGKVTILYALFEVLLVMLIIAMMSMMGAQENDIRTPILLTPVAIFLCLMLMNMLTIFHSRFDCSMGQLLKNTFAGTIAFFLQTAVLTLFMCLPVGIALFAIELFIRLTPLWIMVYYSLATMLGVRLMEKPFQKVESLLSDSKAEEEEEK